MTVSLSTLIHCLLRSSVHLVRLLREYLGHIVPQEGVVVDPSKLEALTNWPVPTSIKTLRGFLGLIGYNRKFIPRFGRIICSLTVLTKKNNFHWSKAATTAFNELKRAICLLRF